jgi:hypothetical protein
LQDKVPVACKSFAVFGGGCAGRGLRPNAEETGQFGPKDTAPGLDGTRLRWRDDVTRHVLASEYLPFRPGFVLTVDRPNTLSIDAPTFTLGLSNARTTSRRPRTCRLAPMEAATRPARLRSDLAAAADPRLGTAKEPTITTH